VGSSWAGVGVPPYPFFPSTGYNAIHGSLSHPGRGCPLLPTFTVVYWLPVFVSEAPCLILTESLNFCHQHKFLRVNAFVIMPTHAHLVVFDADYDNQRLQNSISAIRQYTGRQLAGYCEQKMPKVYGQLVNNPRRSDRERQFWQASRHPVAIWTEGFWRTKVNYLHDNPRRKGLVHEATAWRFSSAAYWLQEPSGASDVILTGVQW
jgi:REP element-mobilizing transposase RayT